MDIAAWLDSLGLGQYEQTFRDNEIDERVLPSLTAEDLKDLGVKLVGHRRRLLDAISALDASAPVVAATAGTDHAAPRSDAERRQLTVMFCALVGSTALASRLDPEDLREVIGAYHKCVAETIGRFDGFVAKYMGDGVLVYFGYPEAHEDDAERTIRRPSRSLPGQACPGAAEGSRSDADPGSRSPPDWIKAQRQVTGPSLEPGPRFLSDQESWGPAPGGWEA
jgi:hypothetical protein